jgi:hypothetical protein
MMNAELGVWIVAGRNNASMVVLFLVERNAVNIVPFLVERNVLHDELCLLKRNACTLLYMAYSS